MTSPAVTGLRAAHARGLVDRVVRDGDRVLASLGTSDRFERAEALALLGAAHAAQDRVALACHHFERCVRELPEPTSASTRRARGQLDWAELALVDLWLRLGRYRDARALVEHLTEPQRAPETRLHATRAAAALAAVRGDHETAHQLLNTATGIADRIDSRFRSALVDGDRAVLLALQDRLYEAVSNADRILPSLVRPASGTYQRWSNGAGAAVALTVGRLCANAGDQMTAQRMLVFGTAASRATSESFFAAHLDLTRGAFWGGEGEPERADTALGSALRIFQMLGAEPSVALATLEQGRLATARGLVHSARPLLDHARAAFAALGQPREAAEAERLARGAAGATGGDRRRT